MILAEHSVGCPLKLGWMNSNIRDKGVTLVREPRVTNPSRLCQWTQSFTILLSLSCTTSHPWVFLNASRADQCGVGQNRTKGLTATHRTSRGDTPSAPTSHYLLTPTHTNTNTTHRKFLLVPLFPPPLHIHTQGNGISCRDVIFVPLSL